MILEGALKIKQLEDKIQRFNLKEPACANSLGTIPAAKGVSFSTEKAQEILKNFHISCYRDVVLWAGVTPGGQN